MKKLQPFLPSAGAFVLSAALFAASALDIGNSPPLFRCILGTGFILAVCLWALFRARKKRG